MRARSVGCACPCLAPCSTGRYRQVVSRILKWLAICAFVAVPFVLFIGRTHTFGCEPPVTGPCDVIRQTPGWTTPVLVSCIAAGLILLILAAVASNERDD